MSRAAHLTWGVALFGVACGDPAFVSLGRNVQSVASAADAGSPAVGSPAVGSLVPDDMSCAQGGASDLPDDVLSPVDIAALDCQAGAPQPPLGCPLTGERELIDSPCEQRQPVSCSEDLSAMLFDVIGRCTDLAYQLIVSFDAGCATAFRIEALQPLASPSVRECVAGRLAAERYDCAQTVDCALGSTFPRVTR